MFFYCSQFSHVDWFLVRLFVFSLSKGLWRPAVWPLFQMALTKENWLALLMLLTKLGYVYVEVKFVEVLSCYDFFDLIFIYFTFGINSRLDSL